MDVARKKSAADGADRYSWADVADGGMGAEVFDGLQIEGFKMPVLAKPAYGFAMRRIPRGNALWSAQACLRCWKARLAAPNISSTPSGRPEESAGKPAHSKARFACRFGRSVEFESTRREMVADALWPVQT